MHKKEAAIYLHPKVLFCRPFNHPFSYEHNNRTLNISTQHKYSKRSEVSKKRTLKKSAANLHHIGLLVNMA
jgi:hypothetical protein